MKEFRRWVFEGKLPDSRDVRDLSDILADQNAIAKFKKGDMRGAKQVLFAANPSLVSGLYSVVDQAASELRGIPLSELEDLRNGAQAKLQKLRDLHQAIENVAKHTGIKL